MLELQEAQQAFQELAGIVSRSGLQWLVEDVQRQIYIGKDSSEEIEVYDADYTNIAPKRRGRPMKVIGTRPYSDSESLLLLIQSIEAASLGLSLGLRDTFEMIQGDLEGLESLGFAADSEGGGIKTVGPEFLNRREDWEKLHSLLTELKEQI